MIKSVVTDIEGTTTDIQFVHKVLFPYSRAKMANFLQANHKKPEIKAAMEEILPGGDLASITQQLISWIDADMKIGPLKTIQGYIWQEGFQEGQFKAHVYEDAYATLKRWHEEGIDLYIYSSGSDHAQKLLFQHSIFGDMRPLFKGYFDTKVGPKKEPTSYKAILDAIGLPGQKVLFLSDVVLELDAATKSAMHTCLINRDNAPHPSHRHPSAISFTEIPLRFASL